MYWTHRSHTYTHWQTLTNYVQRGVTRVCGRRRTLVKPYNICNQLAWDVSVGFVGFVVLHVCLCAWDTHIYLYTHISTHTHAAIRNCSDKLYKRLYAVDKPLSGSACVAWLWIGHALLFAQHAHQKQHRQTHTCAHFRKKVSRKLVRPIGKQKHTRSADEWEVA